MASRAAGGVAGAPEGACGVKAQRRRELLEQGIRRSRTARAKRQLAVSVAAALLLALAGLGVLAWWESGQECVRFAQKLEALGGSPFWSYVCVEWKPRREGPTR